VRRLSGQRCGAPFPPSAEAKAGLACFVRNMVLRCCADKVYRTQALCWGLQVCVSIKLRFSCHCRGGAKQPHLHQALLRPAHSTPTDYFTLFSKHTSLLRCLKYSGFSSTWLLLTPPHVSSKAAFFALHDRNAIFRRCLFGRYQPAAVADYQHLLLQQGTWGVCFLFWGLSRPLTPQEVVFSMIFSIEAPCMIFFLWCCRAALSI